jgi:hypothetical protein
MSEALRRWADLEAQVNGRTFFGQNGVRDPQAPCDQFERTPDGRLMGTGITADGSGSCMSDGHYLCCDCVHLSRESERYQEADWNTLTEEERRTREAGEYAIATGRTLDEVMPK